MPTLALRQDVTTLIKISPNPAVNLINVELYRYTGKVVVQLMDLQGKVLIQKNVNISRMNFAKCELNVRTLPGGTYYVVVSNEKGEIKKETVIIAR